MRKSSRLQTRDRGFQEVVMLEQLLAAADIHAANTTCEIEESHRDKSLEQIEEQGEFWVEQRMNFTPLLPVHNHFKGLTIDNTTLLINDQAVPTPLQNAQQLSKPCWEHASSPQSYTIATIEGPASLLLKVEI
jgi:hypothetical protein